MPSDKPLSEFLLELTRNAIQSEAMYMDALAQLSAENRRIVEENDLQAAREVILSETGGQEVYFWIFRWII